MLTEAGKARLEKAAPDHVEQVRRHFVDRLSRQELEYLVEALSKVADTPPAASSAGSPLGDAELGVIATAVHQEPGVTMWSSHRGGDRAMTIAHAL